MSASRREVEIRFRFLPRIFRSSGNKSCMAELTLVFGRTVLRLKGVCRRDLDAGGTGARVQFAEPIVLQDYALLRRACGLEGVAEEPEAAPHEPAPLLESQTA